MNKRSYLVALLLCLCGQLGANDLVLRPAAAEYAISVSGVPTGMSANIDLQHLAHDHFSLTFSVDNKLIRHQEKSRFNWRFCHAQPMGYAYQSSGFGIRRGGQVDFDWPGMKARGTRGAYAIDGKVVDALGLAMMARCQLKSGMTALTFEVAEPEGVTAFNYEVVGREQLKTPRRHLQYHQDRAHLSRKGSPYLPVGGRGHGLFHGAHGPYRESAGARQDGAEVIALAG